MWGRTCFLVIRFSNIFSGYFYLNARGLVIFWKESFWRLKILHVIWSDIDTILDFLHQRYLDASSLGPCNQLPLMECPLYERHISGFYTYSASCFFSSFSWLFLSSVICHIFLSQFSWGSNKKRELRSVCYICYIITATSFLYLQLNPVFFCDW